jgi:hypothetical protein
VQSKSIFICKICKYRSFGQDNMSRRPLLPGSKSGSFVGLPISLALQSKCISVPIETLQTRWIMSSLSTYRGSEFLASGVSHDFVKFIKKVSESKSKTVCCCCWRTPLFVDRKGEQMSDSKLCIFIHRKSGIIF